MTTKDQHVEEKQVDASHAHSDFPHEKPDVMHKETAHEAAERGHSATDE